VSVYVLFIQKRQDLAAETGFKAINERLVKAVIRSIMVQM